MKPPRASRRVTFSPVGGEVQPSAGAPAAALATAAAPVSSVRRRKRKRNPAAAAAKDKDDYDDDDDDDDDDVDDDDDGTGGGAHSVAHANSLIHDEDAGTAVTAFNLDDELNDGTIDPVSGCFVPAALRRAAAASPTHSVSSSDEDERAADTAAKVRAGAVAAANDDDDEDDEDEDEEEDGDDDEPDNWVANEEEASRPAPAYADRGSGAGTREPAAKRPRAPDAAAASSRAAERSEAELVMALAAVLEEGETAGGAIRRLKRAADVARLELVTELADELMGVGVLSAYELTRGEVLRRVEWSLTWGAGGGLGAVHGPFGADRMAAWAASAFFAHPTQVGWVRPAATGTAAAAAAAAAACPWTLASTVFRG
jgi:hypothetical protein